MQVLTVYDGYGEKLGVVEHAPEANRTRINVRGMVPMTFFSLTRAVIEIRAKYPNAFVGTDEGEE